LRPCDCTRAAVGHLPLTDPAVEITDADLQLLGSRTAIGPLGTHAINPLFDEPHLGKVRRHVRRQVRRRIMHFVDQLFGTRRAADPPAGARNLGDHGLTVGIDLGQRETQARQIVHILETRIGKITTADLPCTLQQMPDQCATAQAQPIVRRPTELKHLRGQEQRRICHAPGNHHVRLGVQRIDNAVDTQVGIRGNQPLTQ